MLLRLLLLLTVVPMFELFLLLEVHRAIASAWGTGTGLVVTLGTIVATGVLGAALARGHGTRALRAVREATARGEFPADPILDGVLILVGGVLLLTPGLLTDGVGLSLLLPWTRALYRRALARWLRAKVARGEARLDYQIRIGPGSPFAADEETVIDVTPADGPDPPAPGAGK